MQKPFAVTTPEGVTRFLVTKAGEGICAKLIMAGADAKHRVVIRLAGGCGNLKPEERSGLVDLMVADFDGYEGILFTGATREVTKEGSINPMITDIPGFVAQRNPGCVSLGTVPKTWSDYLLKGDSRLSFSDDDSLVPAPGLHRFLIIQEGCEIDSDWDGDLPAYFDHMRAWWNAGFRPALISYNGGGVTWKEIVGAAERGWTLFLYRGSGRKTDEFIEKWETDPDFCRQYPEADVVIIDMSPGALRSAMIEHEFLKQ